MTTEPKNELPSFKEGNIRGQIKGVIKPYSDDPSKKPNGAPPRPTRPDQAVGEDCPDCNGAGYTIEVQAVCCGNVHDNGECRGHCPMPEQYQEQCGGCGGTGKLPPSSQTRGG